MQHPDSVESFVSDEVIKNSVQDHLIAPPSKKKEKLSLFTTEHTEYTEISRKRDLKNLSFVFFRCVPCIQWLQLNNYEKFIKKTRNICQIRRSDIRQNRRRW